MVSLPVLAATQGVPDLPPLESAPEDTQPNFQGSFGSKNNPNSPGPSPTPTPSVTPTPNSQTPTPGTPPGPSPTPTPNSPSPSPEPVINQLPAQLPPESTNTYNINGSSNTTTPPLNPGDIVFVQPPNGQQPGWGVVTTPLTPTTLSVNGNPVGNGDFDISKFGGSDTVKFTTSDNGNWNNISGTYTSPNLGDIVLIQNGNKDSVWGVVTSTKNGNFTINDANLNPSTTYVMTKLNSPNLATTAVDVNIDGKLMQSMDFQVGDWVLANTGSGYKWGVVTTAEYVVDGGRVSILRLNGEATAPIFRAGSRVSKITPVRPKGYGQSSSWKYWVLLGVGIVGIGGVVFWFYKRFLKEKAEEEPEE